MTGSDGRLNIRIKYPKVALLPIPLVHQFNYATAAFRKLATFEPRRATRKRGPITNIVRFCNPAAGAKMLLAPPTPRDLLDHGATL